MKKSYKKIIGLTLCIIMCIGMLTSCGATSFSKAKKNAGAMAEKLVDEGYYAVVVDSTYVQDEFDDDVHLYGVKTAVMSSHLRNYKDIAVVLYCDSRANAEKTYNEFIELENEDPDEFEGIVVKKSGKMVFAGTEQAWEDVTEGRVRDIILGTLATIVIAGAVVVALVVVVLIGLIISKISKKRMKAKLTKEITATIEAAAEKTPVEEAVVEAPAEE